MCVGCGPCFLATIEVAKVFRGLLRGNSKEVPRRSPQKVGDKHLRIKLLWGDRERALANGLALSSTHLLVFLITRKTIRRLVELTEKPGGHFNPLRKSQSLLRARLYHDIESATRELPHGPQTAQFPVCMWSSCRSLLDLTI